jgi:uncharacterized protein YodC (DUF2158 family)
MNHSNSLKHTGEVVDALEGEPAMLVFDLQVPFSF